MNDASPSTCCALTARQKAIRNHAGGRPLRRAVRLAAFGFFRFTHCSSAGNALWSETQRVWLGEKTFIHWAMCDPEIDVPRTVDTAADAPKSLEELRRIVRAELNAYWAHKLTSLPCRDTHGWMPLP